MDNRNEGTRRKAPRRKGSIVWRILGIIGRIIWGTIKAVVTTVVTVALIGICTGVLMLGIFQKYIETSVMPTVQVRAEDYTMKLSSKVYYQDKETGEWVDYQTIYGVENRIWVDFEQIPDALWQAAVAIEDERFFTHQGVDWKRTGAAVLNIFTGNPDTFGGSTITQQMLKNMTGDDDGTINRKVREIFRALEFEKNYTKNEILELYLNEIFLGKSCYGVQTAAEYYFGKDVSELTTAECASLIAITNNPSLYGPMSKVVVTNPETGVKKTARELNKQRQETILWKMYDPETGLCYLTEEEYKAACAQTLEFTDGAISAEDLIAEAYKGDNRVNSWFVEQAFKDVTSDLAKELRISEDAARTLLYNGGYQIYTTLDPAIQEIAESVYEDRSNLDVTSTKGQLLQSGITIIDPASGNVVAMVGAVGEKDANLLWNFAVGRRQVGSSIKPLTVYGPALDAGVVSPGMTFDNYPVRLLNDNPWPKNSPNKYTGWTSVSDGVRSSINTIAVQVLEAVGVTDSFAFATERLGLGLVPEDMNLSALGLGGLTYGLNTEEMAAAYASFSNGGVYNKPRLYLEVKDADGNTVLKNDSEAQVIMKESTAYLMTQMLRNVVTGGTGTAARFGGMEIAGKTGTTSENYDRYFVGYTPYYTAAVWTGYEYNEKISYNGNPAITMWKLVMEKIHETLPEKSFEKPSTGLETIRVCKDSGLLCTEACHADVRGDREVTVTVATGTEPKESCTMHVMRDYCVAGQCMAGPNCIPGGIDFGIDLGTVEGLDAVLGAGVVPGIEQKAFLEYVREDYGETITAEDDMYLIVNQEKALEETGCPVHDALPPEFDPENPEFSGEVLDPSDPNYQPPVDPLPELPEPERPVEPEGPVAPVEPEDPVEPEVPEVTPPDTPEAPVDPDDEWWNDLWENSGT